MTKKSLFRAFFIAIIFFSLLIVTGIIIKIIYEDAFSTFKDLLPLVLGIAAAWLSYCIQRRSSYTQQLRFLWTKLVDSIHNAIRYTYLDNPSLDDYINTLTKLEMSIDEIRCVFRNIDESDKKIGLYPFEPIKNIRDYITDLNYGNNYKKDASTNTREKIWKLWGDVRRVILKEFDRDKPTYFHSHFINSKDEEIYDKNNIPKNIH